MFKQNQLKQEIKCDNSLITIKKYIITLADCYLLLMTTFMATFPTKLSYSDLDQLCSDFGGKLCLSVYEVVK